jgi:hypothetical protein
MPVTWTITRANGEERALQEWFEDSLVRTLVNQGVDTVEVQFRQLTVTQSMPWQEMELMTIKRDGTPWFRGNVLAPTRDSQGRAQSVGTRLVGPWWWLEEIMYQQPRAFITDPLAMPELPFPPVVDGVAQSLDAAQALANVEAVSNPANYPHATIWSSIITLGEDNAGTLEDTRAVILRVLNYAISKGAPFQIGTVSAGIAWPRQEVRDLMCAEVVKRMLRCTPDQVAWFDYTTTPPTLNITNRAGRAPMTITAPDDDPTQITFTARTDLVAKGVTLNFLKRHERTGLVFYSLDQDKAGVVDAPGAVQNTFELQGGAMIDAAGTIISEGEPVPAGLAAALLTSYQQLYYEGTLAVVADDCPAGTAMNRLLNIAGINPELETMNAVIQSQVDTLPGRTQYRCGPPEHLGASDLLSLVRAQRGLKQATDTMQARIEGGTPAPIPQPAPPGGILTSKPGDPGDSELPPGPYDTFTVAAAFTEITRHSGSTDFSKDYPPETSAAFWTRGLTPTLIDVGTFTTSVLSDLSASVTAGSFVGYGNLAFGVYGYDRRHADGWFTTAKVTLTGLGIQAGERIFLVGTKTLSTGVGLATATTQAVRDISSLIFAPGSAFALQAPYGSVSTTNPDAGVGGISTARIGSIVYTEIRVYAPAPLA